MKSITYTVELTKPEHNATFVFMPYRKRNSVGKGHYIKVLRNGEVFEYISGEYHDLSTVASFKATCEEYLERYYGAYLVTVTEKAVA